MIPRGVEIFVALDPIDLRWGFDRLLVDSKIRGNLARVSGDLTWAGAAAA